jgi:hypothetical protein
MGERKMSGAERKALEAANRVLNNWMQSQLADDSEHGGNRHEFLYWESPDQRLFCYTPWKDENGDYWTWVMKPYGRGARSGNATKWKRVGKKVRSRKRKTARKRALTRYQNWMKYLRENDERMGN